VADPDEQAAQLGVASDLGQLRVDSWIVSPTLDAMGDTDHVSGGLDIVATTSGILTLVRRSGANVSRTFDATSAEHLRRVTRSTRIEVVTGHTDRLLRSLTMEAELASATDVGLGDQAVKVSFSLGIDAPNAPVTIPTG
jgi:hypothetical protein